MEEMMIRLFKCYLSVEKGVLIDAMIMTAVDKNYGSR